MKKLIVFDLDGTLAASKAAIDPEMATLFAALLDVVRVAIISGGALPQFKTQVIGALTRRRNARKPLAVADVRNPLPRLRRR